MQLKPPQQTTTTQGKELKFIRFWSVCSTFYLLFLDFRIHPHDDVMVYFHVLIKWSKNYKAIRCFDAITLLDIGKVRIYYLIRYRENFKGFGTIPLATTLSRSTSFVAALLNRTTQRVQTSLPEVDQYSHIANCIMYQRMWSCHVATMLLCISLSWWWQTDKIWEFVFRFFWKTTWWISLKLCHSLLCTVLRVINKNPKCVATSAWLQSAKFVKIYLFWPQFMVIFSPF